MSDIALDYTGQTGDLDLTGSGLSLITGEAAIEQNLRIRLRFFLGEWFLDERQGIPYFRDILVKGPDVLLIRSLFQTAIVTTTGISRVTKLEIDLDKINRKMTLSFAATMDTGAPLVYDNFIIEI